MISADEARLTAVEVFGGCAPGSFDWDALATSLTAAEEATHQRLSAYGYMRHLLDRHGTSAVFPNILGGQASVQAYAQEALRCRDAMPELLLSAFGYVRRMFENIADEDVCFAQLEGMTDPHVLYVLFAGSGQEKKVVRYRQATWERLRRFPSLLDLLPDSYRQAGEALYADTEQAGTGVSGGDGEP